MPEGIFNDFSVTESVKVNDFVDSSCDSIKNNCMKLV